MDFNEFKDKMIDYGRYMDLLFNDKQLKQFYMYMNLILEWNKKINLTAIVEPDDIIIKHFIDSLTISKYIEKDENLVDVGSGAGFPGIPLKIYRPDIDIILVDSLNKRINFLNQVIDDLKLKNICCVHSRIEDFARDKDYRENFKYVTARAVANLAVLSEYLIPLAKVKGKCICMKGNEIDEEVKNGINAIEILGGKIEEVDKFNLANTDIKRNVVIIDKKNNTPIKYPRKAGIPVKEPLN